VRGGRGYSQGFTALGTEITQGNGYIEARRSKKLTRNKIYLDFLSVGLPENIMMVAVLAEGQTSIENAAIEPEIVDSASYLNEMGACVKGAGTYTIRIVRAVKLNGCTYTVIPDRIEAGTFSNLSSLAPLYTGCRKEKVVLTIAFCSSQSVSINQCRQPKLP